MFNLINCQTFSQSDGTFSSACDNTWELWSLCPQHHLMLLTSHVSCSPGVSEYLIMVVICMLLTNSNTAHFLRSLPVINVSSGGGCLNVLPPFLIGLSYYWVVKVLFLYVFFFYVFLYKFYSFSPYIQVKDPFLFMLWGKEWGSFSSILIPSFSIICWKDDPFPPLNYHGTFVENQWPYKCRPISRLCIPCWCLSVHLSVHTQSQLPYIHCKPWNQV